MPIDYAAIERGIKVVLDRELPESYPNGVKVEIEPPEFGITDVPEVAIYYAGEEPDEVEIGGTSPYLTVVRYSIVCAVREETFQASRSGLKELLNAVKAALDTDRNLGGAVDSAQRGTIEPETVEQSGYHSAATLTLNARLMA